MTFIRTTILILTCGLSLFLTKAFLDAAEEEEFKVERFSNKNFQQEVTQHIFFREPQEPLGTIVGAYRPNQRLSNTDTIYLKFTSQIVSVGDVFSIYENQGGVSSLESGFKKIGQRIVIKGFVQITSVLPKAIVGKIFDASNDIRVGDLIGPNTDLNHKISPQEPTADVRGKVLANAGENSLAGPYEFVFLNRGSSDGLRANDKLVVFRTADGSAEVKEGLPEVIIAELIVINTESKFSTAYVLSANDPFERGASFKSARSQVRFVD